MVGRSRGGALGRAVLMAAGCAMALGAASCGDSSTEACAKVHEASCPSDKPNANPDFAYDYKDGDQTDCEEILDGGNCDAELQEYIDCLVADPTCCADADEEGSIDCSYSECNQDAYGACALGGE